MTNAATTVYRVSWKREAMEEEVQLQDHFNGLEIKTVVMGLDGKEKTHEKSHGGKIRKT